MQKKRKRKHEEEKQKLTELKSFKLKKIETHTHKVVNEQSNVAFVTL